MRSSLPAADAIDTRLHSSRDAAVCLVGVTKSFPVRRGWRALLRQPFGGQTVPVLQDVTLDIRDGEFFGLLGPNGAGKTTLFKILATLVTPDHGSLTVAGYDVVRQAADVRRVLTPVVADERSLYWRLSARENLRLFAALYDVGARGVRARADELLAVVGLSEVGEKLVGAFSSGMRQRLLIARALLARPRVLLLDEPTRSLDPISARDFREFLRTEVSSGQRCTVVLATHNAEEALGLCSRVGVLNRGRLLAVGAAWELSREFGDERYRVWTTDPTHAAFAAAAERALVRGVTTLPAGADGWAYVELEIPGGLKEAARVLDVLTCGGVPIARFERVELSLADLIERIVKRGHPEGTRA